MFKKLIFIGLPVIFIGSMFDMKSQQVITSLEQVVYDHCGEPFRNDDFFGKPWGAHEGLLHGVPSDYDWYYGARPGFWFETGDNEAVSTWGQVYEWENGSPDTNIRVQLRNHMLYAYANAQWVVMEDGVEHGLEGSHWAEDFTESFGSVEGRDESGNGGGQSFPMTSGRNLHWWIENWPRAAIPEGTEAYFITCEIRLIPDGDPDADISQAKYLAGVSADAYPTTESFGPGPWPSLSISRHKFVTEEWQTFTAYIAGPMPVTIDQYRNEILSRPLPPGVTTIGPYVNITKPADGEEFINPSVINIEVETKDDSSTITKIEFFSSDTLIGAVDSEPFTFAWSDPPTGNHQIKAKAYNNEGLSRFSQSITIQVFDSQPPNISITHPAEDQTHDENNDLDFRFDVSDSDGQVTKVELYINDSMLDASTKAPFDITWTSPVPGFHEVYAVVTDDTNTKTSSDTINIIVGDCETGSNLLQNSSFEVDKASWNTWFAYQNKIELSLDSTLESGNIFLRAHIKQISGTGFSSIQLYSFSEFIKGKYYRTCFKAKAHETKEVRVVAKEAGLDGVILWQQDIIVGEGPSSYGPFIFKADTTIETGLFGFFLGSDTSDLWVDDIVLTDGQTYSSIDLKFGENHNMLRLYPNPVSLNGQLTIQGPGSKEFNMEIFNVNGSLIYQDKNFSATNSVIIKDFTSSPGIYIVRIYSPKLAMVKRVIVI